MNNTEILPGDGKHRYVIVMKKTGLTYEIQANTSVDALSRLWNVHYQCWDFQRFHNSISLCRRVKEDEQS